MNCLLCGSQKNNLFEQVESFGYPLVYYQCSECGLIYQSMEESQAADVDFYAETYRRVYQSSVEPTKKDLWVQRERAKNLVLLVQTLILDSPNRILDIGASAGVLLKSFQEAFGCDVVGVEPGEAYRAYAQQQGIKMYPSIESLSAEDDQRFELVTMLHVLEHLAEPVSTLEKIRRELLQDYGVLLLEVPNFYSHESYELAHLVCYTPRTIREVLKQAGYRGIFFQAHGLPRSSMLNLYMTVMAQPVSDNDQMSKIRPDRFVGQKRQLGLLYRRIIQKMFPRKAWLPIPDEYAS